MDHTAPPPELTRRERRTRHHGGTGVPQGRRKLSQLLLSSSLVQRKQLVQASAYADQHKITLTDALIILGFVSEMDSYAALARVTGLPLVDLDELTFSPAAVNALPERIARKYSILPLQADEKTLTCATAYPLDDQIARDITFATGRQPKAILASRSQLQATLDRVYPTQSVSGDEAPQAPPREPSAIVTSQPAIELCHQLVLEAARTGASDIHIEPHATGAVVRFRIAGILELVATLPAAKVQPVVNRFKVLAKADISVKHKPQDGGFRLTGERPIDVRLSTLPTVHGESMVMRIIDSEGDLQTLETLGWEQDKLDALRWALERPEGLLLLTGPVGSGKTTVIYAGLQHLNNGSRNIVTIEDPVERRVAGLNQIGLTATVTLAAVLRSVLRQDPNVIMVGEIRDPEVAQLVGTAVYTHLVLTSLHTSDAVSAITRLINLGLEPARVAESLAAIVAHRLVRRLCQWCRITHSEIESRKLAEPHGIKTVPARKGGGCNGCRHTGYSGRVPVVEILVPDDAMRDAITHGARAAEIRAAAKAAGWMTLREAALALVADGVTSIEEVDRVLAADAPASARPAPTGRRPAYRRTATDG